MLSTGWLPCAVQSQVEPIASSLLCQPEHGQRPSPCQGDCALRGLSCEVQPSSDILLFSQVLALCLQLCGQPLKLHWLHKVRDWECRVMVPACLPLHLGKL